MAAVLSDPSHTAGFRVPLASGDRESRSTTVDTSSISNSNIAAVLESFGRCFPVISSNTTSSPGQIIVGGLFEVVPRLAMEPGLELAADPSADALASISSIQRLTGLPLSTVLEACHIKRRTYYSWAKTDRTPRPESLGVLAEVAEVVADLDKYLEGGLSGWLTTDPVARKQFEQGEIDGLVFMATARTGSKVARAAVLSHALNDEEFANGEPGIPRVRQASVSPHRPVIQ